MDLSHGDGGLECVNVTILTYYAEMVCLNSYNI